MNITRFVRTNTLTNINTQIDINNSTPVLSASLHTQSKRGFALIEVLISMLILGLALNGIGGFWSATVQESEHNYARSQAVIIARNIIESVRANSSAWDTYNLVSHWTNDLSSLGVLATTCVSNIGSTVICTPEDIAKSDIFMARQYAQTSLPLDSGHVELRSPCSAGTNAACVVVTWGTRGAKGSCSPLNDGANVLKISKQERAIASFGEDNECVVMDFLP